MGVALSQPFSDQGLSRRVISAIFILFVVFFVIFIFIFLFHFHVSIILNIELSINMDLLNLLTVETAMKVKIQKVGNKMIMKGKIQMMKMI